ncbi:hypothetical protein R1sor_011232 [Riccia sorocarpa]|uniref:Uncharacterized protein n=1 Tax=Riccia sorocarpa TaxID=122646 RepID=A0ABD3I1N8_9MARC
MVRRGQRLRPGRPPVAGRGGGRGTVHPVQENAPGPAAGLFLSHYTLKLLEWVIIWVEEISHWTVSEPPLAPFRSCGAVSEWGWVRIEDIQPIVDEIFDEDVVSLGFVTLLGQHFQQPHFASCLVFIRSYNIDIIQRSRS